MSKILGLLLIISSSVIFLQLTPLGQTVMTQYFGTSQEKLSLKVSKALANEIRKTKRSQQWLPPGEVLIERFGPTANTKLSDDFNPFEIDLESKKRIEITILDLEDKERPGIIFQMGLIDLTTQNKIDELGYTYYY